MLLTLLPQLVRNSSKIPILTVLLGICGDQGQATVPEVEEGLHYAEHSSNHAAVSMALMRYAKLGLISRAKEGRWYHYSPNKRTKATLEFLARSEAANQQIDAKIRYLELSILAGDISTSRGQALGALLTVGTDMDALPERTRRILRTLGMSVAMVPVTEEGAIGARDLLDQLMNDIRMMTVSHDYSDPMMSAVLKAIPAVWQSIERALPEDAMYLLTIYLLLNRIQKSDLDASNWKSVAMGSAQELGGQVAKNKFQFGSVGQGGTTVDPELQEMWKQFEEKLKAYGEKLNAEGEKLTERLQKEAETQAKTKRRLISRSRVSPQPVFRAGQAIRDPKGEIVCAPFILVEGNGAESLESARRAWADSGIHGLVLPLEAADVVPPLTNGPFAEVLKELCDVDMKVDDLSEDTRTKLYGLIRERRSEVEEMLAQVNKTMSEKGGVPMLSDFLGIVTERLRMIGEGTQGTLRPPGTDGIRPTSAKQSSA